MIIISKVLFGIIKKASIYQIIFIQEDDKYLIYSIRDHRILNLLSRIE